MMWFGDAVASSRMRIQDAIKARNKVFNFINTPSLNFYRPDALPDA